MDHTHRKVYETLLRKWANYCYECNGDSQHLNQIDYWCQTLADEEDSHKVQKLINTTEFLHELHQAEFHSNHPTGQTKCSS
jgi:hypothetical protein